MRWIFLQSYQFSYLYIYFFLHTHTFNILMSFDMNLIMMQIWVLWSSTYVLLRSFCTSDSLGELPSIPREFIFIFKLGFWDIVDLVMKSILSNKVFIDRQSWGVFQNSLFLGMYLQTILLMLLSILQTVWVEFLLWN